MRKGSILLITVLALLASVAATPTIVPRAYACGGPPPAPTPPPTEIIAIIIFQKAPPPPIRLTAIIIIDRPLATFDAPAGAVCACGLTIPIQGGVIKGLQKAIFVQPQPEPPSTPEGVDSLPRTPGFGTFAPDPTVGTALGNSLGTPAGSMWVGASTPVTGVTGGQPFWAVFYVDVNTSDPGTVRKAITGGLGGFGLYDPSTGTFPDPAHIHATVITSPVGGVVEALSKLSLLAPWMLLGGLGASFLGLFAWRRRNKP